VLFKTLGISTCIIKAYELRFFSENGGALLRFSLSKTSFSGCKIKTYDGGGEKIGKLF
jgi:hypothetical protein